MSTNIFDNFKLFEKAQAETINNFNGYIPEQVLEVWNKYGFGSILNGYLNIVNPEEYQELLKDVYVRNEDTLVLFTTSMGDLIVWEDNKYLILLNFRKGEIKGISSGFKYFFPDLEDESFYQEILDWNPYPEAVEKYGEPDFDECFGYTPLLGLGGPEKVENMKKVKLIEHIYLITQFMGPIE
ncbi:T6SS immunity protein Tdi1 domain-containing protein [Peribacillus sp. NPDC096540]|uniref:T6SS immunity protein Tdi1 domain-containing protein n=1 Tax=Peribacillus sp. NPDC096540 TaxID=3390612 RepID=UPI003CFE7D36